MIEVDALKLARLSSVNSWGKVHIPMIEVRNGERLNRVSQQLSETRAG
jgi:hypothetical protein